MLLRRSFIHLPGIGPGTERRLWERGILDWEALGRQAAAIYREPRATRMTEALQASERAWKERDLAFFYGCLPREHLWRILPGQFDDIAYLDIETTGLGHPPLAHSTTITFYFRGEVLQEHEHERKRRLIRKVLSECSLIASFYGEAFDVPFLQKEFGIEFDKAHVDLCFWLKRLGYGGGLKKVQKLFPDIPDRASMDIDGFDAVRLWRMHERGVEGALETLLTYNAEDTVVLEPLLIKAYNLEVKRNPHLGLEPVPDRSLPELRTRIHSTVYRRLRSRD